MAGETGKNDPLKQFAVETIAPIGPIGGLDVSFTNIAFFSAGAAGLIIAFLWAATARAAIIPGRLQSVAELSYEFIAGMIRDIIGQDGMKFFPLVFTLFMFVLVCNAMGLIAIFPTVTSQLAVTFTLALVSISVVVIYGVAKHGFGFLRLFAPSGLPLPMYLIITPIEIISFLARPVTLGFRLFANMLAGHVLLKVFAGFVPALAGLGALGILGSIVPLFAVFAVMGLEVLVAFLQAYVFAILTVIYLNDVVHMHH